MSSPHSREINLVRCLKCGKILKCSRYDTMALLEHVRDDHPEVDIVDTDTKQKRTTGREATKFSPKEYINSYAKQSTTNCLRQEDRIEDGPYSDEDCYTEKFRPYSKEQEERYENTEDEERREQGSRQLQYPKNVDLTNYSITSDILQKYPEIKQSEETPHNPNAQVIYTRRYRVTTPPSVSPSVLHQPFQRSLYRTSIEKWCPVNGAIYCPKCGCHKRPLIKTKAEHFTYNECMACCLLSCWPFCFLPWIAPRDNNDHLYCANCKTFLGLYDRNTNSIKPNGLYISHENRDYSGVQAAQKNWGYLKENKMLETESPPPGAAGDSTKSKKLSSIIINGKELPPETVARIQKYKRFGTLVGLDIDALSNPTDFGNSSKKNGTNKENPDAVSPMAKQNK